MSMFLGDIAHRDKISISAAASIREALSLMNENGYGAVVVLEDSRPIGILTERDAVRLLYHGVKLDKPAGAVARKTLYSASGRRTIGHALTIMLENNIRRLIVTDASGAFVGLVTQQDLLRHMEDDYFRASLEVRHILDQRRPLISAKESDRIALALRRMVDNGIGAVPVVDGGRVIGIITEKDILRLTQEGMSLQDSLADRMSRPVIIARMNTKLVDIVHLMNSRSIRRVVIEDEAGMAVAIVTNRDIIKNLEGNYSDFLERKLRHTKEVLNLLPEILLEIIDTGEEQVVVWANDKAQNSFGREIVDKPVAAIIPEERWKEIYATLSENGKIEDVRFIQNRWIYEFSGFYLPMEKAAERGRIQLIMRDITDEVTQAVTDPLTNIFNRRYMNEFLVKEMERCRRTGRCFSVAMADLDDFKSINDTYGHSAGDTVLRNIADTMVHFTREYDSVGRYGGEEFFIIMPETDMENAVLVIDRLRRAIQQYAFESAAGEDVRVTASFGLATYNKDGNTPEELLVKADERLYRAKTRGKNTVVAVDGPDRILPDPATHS